MDKQKMKTWVTTRRFLTWLCVLPADKATFKSKKLLPKAITILIFAIFIINFVSSVMFVWKFARIHLEESLFVLMQITGFLSYLFLFVSTYLMRYKVKELLDMLEDIHSASKTFFFQFK